MRTYWRGYPERGAAEPADTVETSSWRFNASRKGCVHKIIVAPFKCVPRIVFIAVPTRSVYNRREARAG